MRTRTIAIVALAIVLALVLWLVVFDDDDADAAPVAPAPVGAFAAGDTPVSRIPMCTDITPEKPAVASDRSEPNTDPTDPQARVCRAETSDINYGPAPSHTAAGATGYHFATVEDNNRDRQGVRSKINSVNPNVCHDCQARMFVAEWVMSLDRRPGCIGGETDTCDFIQAGWIERAEQPNDRHVFSFNEVEGFTRDYYQFPLTDGQDNGQSYAVRYIASGFGWEWATYVWYNGAWRLLDTEWMDLPPNTGQAGSETAQAFALEVYVGTQPTPLFHPCVPTHINTKGQVYTSPFNAWIDWDASHSPFNERANTPYFIDTPYAGTAEVWATGGGC